MSDRARRSYPRSLCQAKRLLLQVRRAFEAGGVSHVIQVARARLRNWARVATNNELSAFDEKYGTDTSGKVDQVDLDTHKFASWWHAVAYQPAWPGLINQLLAATGIDPRSFTFVDVGSGKGRMVLEAAEAGFLKSVGVEFSESLLCIARRNAASFRERTTKDAIEFHYADASEFELPEGPLVVFLYNPFGEPVMRQVARRAAERWATNRDPLSIWYHNPVCRECWDKAGFARSAELPELDTIVWTAGT